MLVLEKQCIEKIIAELGVQNHSSDDKKETPKMSYIDEKAALLKKSKNLIFTGAPGTGKTFLAQEIAAKLIGIEADSKEKRLELLQKSGQYDFVQFHPSYDYTDFVEGLRAEDLNGQVIFNLHDGLFKTFCKRAVSKYKSTSFDDLYNLFAREISKLEGNFTLKTLSQSKEFKLTVNSNNSFVAIPTSTNETEMILTKDRIRDYCENEKTPFYKPYLIAVGNYFKAKYNPAFDKTNDSPYVFVIDEINRGEISKIFGELFFSIDPGYRGIKGKVKTQYTNLIEDDDVFKDGFYIPENVYIIGTMNDIDRSVESFDFAMRRRFVWDEVSAEQSAENMQLPEKSPESVVKMNALNNAISGIPGLNSSYHVGAAYFLDKDGKPVTDYNELWEIRLKPLLREYLRGMPEAEVHLTTLKNAYDLM
jgi:5-methylcytosine-specific restriction endonuclease McrBC GTP-binding regulatory subunit McrB